MNLVKKLIELRTACTMALVQMINFYGTESSLSCNKCLTILDNDFKYNLYGRRYLIEVWRSGLIDDEGHNCGFDVLGIEKLSELTMYMVKTWDRKNIITFDKGTESDKDVALAMAWDYLTKEMSQRPDFGEVILVMRKARE